MVTGGGYLCFGDWGIAGGIRLYSESLELIFRGNNIRARWNFLDTSPEYTLISGSNTILPFS